MTKRVRSAMYKPDKRSWKSIGNLELNFPYMTMLKVLKYKPCISFRACQKKFVEFTDLTHTIY